MGDSIDRRTPEITSCWLSSPKGSPRPFEVCDSQATFSAQTVASRSAPLRSETMPVDSHMALTSRSAAELGGPSHDPPTTKAVAIALRQPTACGAAAHTSASRTASRWRSSDRRECPQMSPSDSLRLPATSSSTIPSSPAYVPDNPTALVFSSPEGAPLRNGNFRRRIWHSAVEQAGLPQSLRIHDLRHTCASLLIAAGANPKAVQTHLGHSSITVTKDRYTHLFPSDIDQLIRRLDDVRARTPAAQLRPQRPISRNPP